MTKLKRCKYCKTEFEAKRPLQAVCSPTCAIEQGKRNKARQEAKKAIAERKQTKARLLELKPLSWYEKKCEAAVNRYCRLRDLANGYGCISCDKGSNWHGQWHASHFKSVGANSFLRYNVWNINLGCSQCNKWLSGNIGEYTKRLPAKIGERRFLYLENAPRERRFTREYLERLTRLANRRAKRYIT